MWPAEAASLTWVYLACFALSVVSALVPWFNGEVLLLTFAASVPSRGALVPLVLAATAGQMAGKCVLYFLARAATARRSAHTVERLGAWRQRLEARPVRALVLVFVSSAIGVPPFYVVTLLAGTLHIGFRGFVGMGTAGRLVRFGALALVPAFALHLAG